MTVDLLSAHSKQTDCRKARQIFKKIEEEEKRFNAASSRLENKENNEE